MLRVMGSRVLFSVLAAVLVVLLNSTPTSATPVAVAAAGLPPPNDLETVQYPVLEKREKPTTRDRLLKVKKFYIHACIHHSRATACWTKCMPDNVRDEDAYRCVRRQCRAKNKWGTYCPADYFDYQFTYERRVPRGW